MSLHDIILVRFPYSQCTHVTPWHHVNTVCLDCTIIYSHVIISGTVLKSCVLAWTHLQASSLILTLRGKLWTMKLWKWWCSWASESIRFTCTCCVVHNDFFLYTHAGSLSAEGPHSLGHFEDKEMFSMGRALLPTWHVQRTSQWQVLYYQCLATRNHGSV